MDSERPRSSTPKKPPARIYTWGLRCRPTPLRGGGTFLASDLRICAEHFGNLGKKFGTLAVDLRAW